MKNRMITKWECKLNILSRKTKELRTIEELQDFNELKNKVENLFESTEVEYIKVLENKKKELEELVKESEEKLKESENKLKARKDLVSKPILVFGIIALMISVYAFFTVKNVRSTVNKHEQLLVYSEDINYDKDKPIQYGSIGESLTEGDFKITVNSVEKVTGTMNKIKSIINITVENISEEDKKITPEMFVVKGEDGSKTSPALTIGDNITQIINRGRKANFDYAVYPEKSGVDLELEFGRAVIKLY